MRNLRTIGAIAAGALAATALTGVAIATQAIADDEPGTSESRDAGEHREGPHPGPRGHGGPLGGEHGVLHGELVVETDEGVYETRQVQRGEVTAVSASSITVVSEDGYSATYTLDDSTVQERDRAEGPAQVGDSAHVVGSVDGSTVTAERVHALSPERAAEREEHREQWEEWRSQRPDSPEGPGRMRGPGGMHPGR